MAVYNLREGIPQKFMTGDILNYPYRLNNGSYGGTLRLRLPKGIYWLEAWGCASGYVTPESGWNPEEDGGTGGYAKGTLTLSSPTYLYLTAGGVGTNGGQARTYDSSTRTYTEGSGGASDIRLVQNSFYNRVLVAGGGGKAGTGEGWQPPAELPGGGGGGASGQASGNTGRHGKGGTQTAGGAGGAGYSSQFGYSFFAAGFGTGGYVATRYSEVVGASGGGGWYGGGYGGYQQYNTQIGEVTATTTIHYGGGGGSGFVFSSATAGNVPSGYALGSDYYLTDTQNITGHDSGSPITEPDGTTAAGHSGEGYVRITVIQGQLDSPVVTDTSEPTQGTLRISFGAVANASAYRVTDENGSTLATLNASPYTESGIVPDTEYIRKITATSPSYAPSEPTTVAYLSTMKLATPTNLRASYAVNATTIRWNAVSGATSYEVSRDGASVGTVNTTQYRDASAGEGTSHTYTVVAKASGRWDSDPASITTGNQEQLDNPTNISATQTVRSVTLTWTGAANATSYDIYRDGVKRGTATETSFTDSTARPGNTYRYLLISKAEGYYDSTGASYTVVMNPQLATPTLVEASQTTESVTLNWGLPDYGAPITYTLRRDGVLKYQGHALTYTDTGLTAGATYNYRLIASIPGSGYYDSNPANLTVLVGRDMNTIDRQKDYLQSLRRPFVKLCRLRFLNPNGTTAFALDNNPRNKRSRTFIASGSVSANLQNGQRMTATVTLDNVNLKYETNVNKIWFGQEIALDEGLMLSDGSEYYRQTGVFLIDNPQEKYSPKDRTVTFRLVDKWADLDGTLGGKLEGTYEVPVGTNIFEPISAILAEDRGNGRPVDATPPVYTEYYNDKTQELPDGTEASMTDSPYTLTVQGGGTKAQVILGLAGMVNAWVGYDNTGRLRIDPSQDDILDTNKPVLWRFSPEETQILGAAYTVKKEDVYNDYIVVGEQLDDYTQPGGRATNLDPRSDTNVDIIGRKTFYESASGYATSTQCRDLAEWKLKRSSVLQKAVSVSCSQMMHIDLNSLVEIVRTDKPGSPIERHLVQGFTRPLAYSGAMTISAVSTADFPTATVTQWPASLSG